MIFPGIKLGILLLTLIGIETRCLPTACSKPCSAGTGRSRPGR